MTLQDATRGAYAAVAALSDEGDDGPTLPGPDTGGGMSAPETSRVARGRAAPRRVCRRNRRRAAGRR